MNNIKIGKKSNKKNKIILLFGLVGFLVLTSFLMFHFLNNGFFDNKFSIKINFIKYLKKTTIIIGSIAGLIIVVFLILKIFKLIPYSFLEIDHEKIIQKKKILPFFRVSKFLKIQGMPRKAIKSMQSIFSENDKDYTISRDIISSLSRSGSENSFWIIKKETRIEILFSVSCYSWFTQKKATEKTNKGIISLKAAFNNIYSTIIFEPTKKDEINAIKDTITKTKYGLITIGIPAQKFKQNQVDRLINTLNTLEKNACFIVSFKGVKKGHEKCMATKLQSKYISEEYQKDFFIAKKTRQCKVGVYAFTENQADLQTVVATTMSIWSGTHTFDLKELDTTINKKIMRKKRQLLLPKKTYLSNKAVSFFIHLPERSFFTKDTNRPIFEIPSKREEKNQEEIIIGELYQNGKNIDTFTLPLQSFLYNTEIVGMIGRGKTYLVLKIIEQLLDTKLGCLIFDLKGEYAKIFADEKMVEIFTIGQPAPLGINLFEFSNQDEIHNVLSLIDEMLQIAGAPFSPTMLNIFENALQKTIKKKVKNLEQFLVCLFESSKEYEKNMKTSYSKESLDAILNRLNYIFGGLNFEVFSSLENTLDLTVLDKGKKIILDFSEYLRRGASTASLFLVCNLILHLLSKHASKKGITNCLRYLVILEEAMYLIPKRYNLESAASLGYSEQNFIMGRSLGIGTISIYQLWDSVSPVVHANSLTKIIFRGEDIEKMRKSINLSEEQIEYLPQLPNRTYILKSKTLSGPALLKTINITREAISSKEYDNTLTRKYKEKRRSYKRIANTLTELRRNIFYKKNYRNFRDSKKREKNQILQNKKDKTINNSRFDYQSWENCINICPARILFRETTSEWIRENFCKKIQQKAKKIANELYYKENAQKIELIMQTNPLSFYSRIVDELKKSKQEYVYLVSFCVLEKILTKIQTKRNYPPQRKNKLLTLFRRETKEKLAKNY